MLESIGSNPLNYHAQTAQAPVRPPATKVAAPAGSGSAGGATEKGLAGQDARQNAERAAERAPAAKKEEQHVLTGPPPAFQASLLEVESDLRMAIARIEAARGHGRGEGGFREAPPPSEPASEPAPQAEAREASRPRAETRDAAPKDKPEPDEAQREAPPPPREQAADRAERQAAKPTDATPYSGKSA